MSPVPVTPQATSAELQQVQRARALAPAQALRQDLGGSISGRLRPWRVARGRIGRRKRCRPAVTEDASRSPATSDSIELRRGSLTEGFALYRQGRRINAASWQNAVFPSSSLILLFLQAVHGFFIAFPALMGYKFFVGAWLHKELTSFAA